MIIRRPAGFVVKERGDFARGSPAGVRRTHRVGVVRRCRPFINWLLRLLPTNPICMRLVQGGSRRMRHLYIRAGYLAVMIVVLLFVLLTAVGGGNALHARARRRRRAACSRWSAICRSRLICLLTPVFMAGAIAQEANPRTWDILLTTPLSNLQLVLGNLFGRLFFVIALLFSSLPLFVMTQFFGGVPGDSIFASYAIAGTSALLVAAIAVTLSVTRTAGRRAVFLFYVSVVDVPLAHVRGRPRSCGKPIQASARPSSTRRSLTPLNPFLALKVLLDSNQLRAARLHGRAGAVLARVACGSARPITDVLLAVRVDEHRCS